MKLIPNYHKLFSQWNMLQVFHMLYQTSILLLSHVVFQTSQTLIGRMILLMPLNM